jgi:hypothetical protein
VTETRSNRHGLPLWSSGSDSGSRSDFTEAFTKLNAQAAWDDGGTDTELPVDDLVAGRYQLVVIGGTYRVLYRRHDSSGWDAVGGNTMPNSFHYRALSGQARADAAVTFSHPDHVNPGATIGYDGSAVLSGTVRVFDDDESGRGALIVGTNAAVGYPTLGRAHIRTRATGERALTVQAHAADAGNLFTVRTAGEADALHVDALGRLRGTAPSSFGGAPIPTLASLAVAPTANDADDTITGLLLHGSTGSAEILAKSIMQIWRDATEGSAPLADFKRDTISIGRLPWATSGLTLAATGHTVRASGVAGNAFFWRLRRSDATSGANEANAALDATLLEISNGGWASNLPLFVTQRYRTAQATASFYRVGDFSASFIDLARLVPDGLGGETAQLASAWDSDGRLRVGAWWRSTGTVRDARQSVHHVCRKDFAVPGESPTSGQPVNPNSIHTLTWTSMTMRSSGTTDLRITTSVGLILRPNLIDNNADAQLYSVRTLVSVNGGSYTEIGISDNAQVTPEVRPVQTYSGDAFACEHRLVNVPAGATVQVRTVFSVSEAVPLVYLRSLAIDLEECVIETYASPA